MSAPTGDDSSHHATHHLVRDAADLVDVPGRAVVLDSRTSFTGRVWSVVTDQVGLAGGEVVERDVVRHPGAVAVMALDDQDRLVLVQQYRHPVGARLWEAPAGLCDEPGESLQRAAERELAEETGLVARRWERLLDIALTPGGSDERIRVFLARDLHAVAADEAFVATGEEASMVIGAFALDDVVGAVLDGRVRNAVLVAGTLAVAALRDRGWPALQARS